MDAVSVCKACPFALSKTKSCLPHVSMFCSLQDLKHLHLHLQVDAFKYGSANDYVDEAESSL